MKIAAHILAYNVNQFIDSVINNLENQVDKIYIAYSEIPWGYVSASRVEKTNPTSLEYIKLVTTNRACPIEIVIGDWNTEEDMRNACLSKARSEGFDWFLIQDADEFYSEETWGLIKKILRENKGHNHFVSTWYNFWKSPQYVLSDFNGSIKGTNAGFAIRCASDIIFVKKRLCNNEKRAVLDCPCFHYGYVMSDSEMLEKISTWGHANEFFSNKWYEYKWLNWTERTQNLHPVTPYNWKKAIRFPLNQPDFIKEIDDFSSSTNSLHLDGASFIGNKIYDMKTDTARYMTLLKNVVKATF